MSGTLAAGKRLGPYEIVAPIGSGGMGDVYRGRDTRLGREVAIKVLAPALSADPLALDRFRQEAQAASALSHPNIITVHDIGLADVGPFIVTELLEGETLREAIERNHLTTAQALACMEQAASGLSAAHSKGILHRDIKPDNLFVTSSGTLKILDFGLAKLTDADAERTKTGPGVLLGTEGYVSPEQIRHQAVDHRTDIFSLGVVLYESLTGRKPFSGESLAETLSKILNEDPPQVSELRPGLTDAIDEVVRACLQKNPSQRFDSAADVARTLRAVSRFVPDGRGWFTDRFTRIRALAAVMLVALIATLAATAIALAAELIAMTEPVYRRVTFARATINSARFRPGSSEVIYDAIREDAPRELLATVPGSTEVRPLGIHGAELLAISPSGDLALSLNRRLVNGFVSTGTLAVMAEGRAPRDVIEDVHWADWAADGKSLAIVREVNGRTRLEFPINTLLFETSGWISDPRVSPDGTRIAFVDHPVSAADRGHVMVAEFNGAPRVLAADWLSVLGLAWSAAGDEVWFTAQHADGMRALRAVDLNGRSRIVANAPARLRLLDIARDGRVLLARDDVRLEAHALGRGGTDERNLSWFDWSLARDISSDGGSLLMTEYGEAAGAEPGIYLRRMDGSPAAKLGTGSGIALSPDAQRVLTIWDAELQLLPVGPGEIISLANPPMLYHPWAAFAPDGRRIVFTAAEPGRARRVYIQELPNGPPTPISPEGFRVASPGSVSPSGDSVIVVGDDERLFLCSVSGGPPRPLAGAMRGEMAAQWQPDGRGVFVFEQRQIPARVFRLSLDGDRELVKTLAPDDRAGVIAIHRLVMTPAVDAYAYTLERQLSDIYVATGFRQPPLTARALNNLFGK
ncbi:MAG TPA: protein kinase [Vicinamibacterales bacterium]|nr:protein kinase [Vicinamibacterales bacterium]